MRPLLLGLAAGLVMSLGVTRALASELVQVSPADPLTYACTCLVLLAFAAIGCLAPARRAMRVDPVVALRHE
jgi:putative ABC transport system permease protein